MNKKIKNLVKIFAVFAILAFGINNAFAGSYSGYDFYDNPSSFGPFPKSGEVRMYFQGLDVTGCATRITLSKGSQSRTFTPCSHQVINTGINVNAGDYITIFMEDIGSGPDIGWSNPVGNMCGSGLPLPPTGGGSSGYYQKINVSSYISWAAQAGEPLVSKQCWADWPEWYGDYDFNDYFIVFSYVPVPIPSPLPTVNLKVNGSDGPITLQEPADYTLSWTSNNADTCTASGSWSGTKSLNGSQDVYDKPYGTYTYTIRCSNSSGSASDSVTVNVTKRPLPTVNLKVNGSDGPITLQEPADYTLSWTSNNADTCTASGSWSGTKSLNGSQDVYDKPYGTYTYTIRCSNSSGSASDSVTVNVTKRPTPTPIPSPLPTVNLKVNGSDGPITLQEPADYTLSWTSNNADTCTASGSWSGTKSLNGSQDVYDKPYGTYTYTIRCSNSSGSAFDSVTVNVIESHQNVYLTIDKQVRNVTNNTSFSDSVSAKNSDQLEFSIRINVLGSGSLNNIYVQDILPNGLSLVPGSVRIDNNSASDNLIYSGLYLGNYSSGTIKTITFLASVNSSAYNTTLTNVSKAWADSIGTVSDSAYVNISGYESRYTTLSISKTVKDVALNSAYSETLYMRPSTEVEYRIVITNTGSYFAQDVLIKDVLPSGLVYKPNSTYIDGILTNDGITSGGIYIDDLNVGQSKTITYRATLRENSFFTQSLTTLVNNATANGLNTNSISDTATVYAIQQGRVLGAASVDTGADIATLVTIGTAGLSSVSFAGFNAFKKGYLKRKIKERRNKLGL